MGAKGMLNNPLGAGAAWMKGEIIPISEASIPITDWGLTHSDITYDVVPVWKGGFFRLDDYLVRFRASMAELHLDPGMTMNQIRQALISMVAASGLHDSYVSMVCSRGVPSVAGSRDPRLCSNQFYAWCVPYIEVISEETVAAGATMWVAKSVRRIPRDSINPLVKNYQWGDFTQGIFEAKEHGFETVILVDHQENVTEGPGFNVFAVLNGELVTPGLGILGGITRLTIFEIADELSIKAEARALPLTEFMQADEVFITTSAGGVMPIVKVDDRVFSNGVIGPVSERLRQAYWEWMLKPSLRTQVEYNRQ